ncbi:helix-turn-helix domain-containing protein [Nocardia salmonicida]|uniref:helix-turn-helix domain-containing protein n=1 Tax=Nocardia salmonicida TaxID=53431 RepID=UPI0033C34D18
MARKPDVFVRAVTPEEGRKLAQIARRSKVPVRMRRAVLVMASAQHQPVGLIAKPMQVSESYVRQVIRDFNAHGFEALDPKWSGAGRRRPIKRHVIGSLRSLGAAPVTWAGRSVCGVCRSW